VWGICVEKGCGVKKESEEFLEKKCRKAYKLGGLVHVCLLQGRLEKAVEGLKKSGEEECTFKRWPQRWLDAYLGDDDMFLREKTRMVRWRSWWSWWRRVVLIRLKGEWLPRYRRRKRKILGVSMSHPIAHLRCHSNGGISKWSNSIAWSRLHAVDSYVLP
jgi:hypothetical protein